MVSVCKKFKSWQLRLDVQGAFGILDGQRSLEDLGRPLCNLDLDN